MKKYNIIHIRKRMVVVNFFDGDKAHGDGSPFWDIQIFTGQKKATVFTKELEAKGYVYSLG